MTFLVARYRGVLATHPVDKAARIGLARDCCAGGSDSSTPAGGSEGCVGASLTGSSDAASGRNGTH